MEPLKLLTASLFFLVSSGCGSKFVEIETIPDINETRIQNLAVLDLVAENGSKERRMTYKTQEVQESGAEVITRLLFDKLQGFKKLEFLPHSQVDETAEAVRSEDPTASFIDIARKVGERLEVSAVLAGRVTMFVEREGDPYGIERPSSVGFELILMDIPSHKVIWRGDYFETQKSLFSDVTTFPLFLKRKGRWQTAAELAKYGIDEVLSGFPLPIANP